MQQVLCLIKYERHSYAHVVLLRLSTRGRYGCNKKKRNTRERVRNQISLGRMQSAASIYHGTALLNTILTNARCLTNEVTSPQCRCLTDGLMTRIEIKKGIGTECLRTNVAPWRRNANSVQLWIFCRTKLKDNKKNIRETQDSKLLAFAKGHGKVMTWLATYLFRMILKYRRKNDYDVKRGVQCSLRQVTVLEELSWIMIQFV